MSIIAVYRLLPLAVLTLLLSTPAAHAQDTFFPNNTTLTAANPIPGPGDAIVGYANFSEDNSDATGRQIFVQNDSSASFAVTNQAAVPEPSSLFSLSLMLTLCGIAAARRKNDDL